MCLCEQNITGPKENAEARILWLHGHLVRTQSGATAGVSIIPGEFCVQLGFCWSLLPIFSLLLKSDEVENHLINLASYQKKLTSTPFVGCGHVRKCLLCLFNESLWCKHINGWCDRKMRKVTSTNSESQWPKTENITSWRLTTGTIKHFYSLILDGDVIIFSLHLLKSVIKPESQLSRLYLLFFIICHFVLHVGIL